MSDSTRVYCPPGLEWLLSDLDDTIKNVVSAYELHYYLDDLTSEPTQIVKLMEEVTVVTIGEQITFD